MNIKKSNKSPMRQKGVLKMKKYTIEHNNTDVSKLWNLAKNGVFSYQTIHKIFNNENEGLITFNSKSSYDKFKKFEFTASAYH